MGPDLELDFEKYCVVDGSPNTVLLSPRHSKVEKKKVGRKPKCRTGVLLNQNKEFREIKLHRYRSASCRNVRSPLGFNEAVKRGSVYQSSNEVGKMNKISEKEIEGRKKIEFSRSDGPFPLEIFDSLCGSDDDDDGSLGSISSSVLEMSLKSLNKQENQQPLSVPLNKSLSSRLEQPHSPTKSENNLLKTNSPQTRFSPFKKMFDPFVKSKSQRKNNTLRKSLIDDSLKSDYDSTFLKKDSCSSIVSSSSFCSSPAHLNGILKLGNKNSMPYFEFLVKNPNDVLVAKTLKVENGHSWVYTFHSAQQKRKMNAKDLSTVGQMRVSCYLCTELVNAGSFDDSMVSEFVLYDLSHSSKSASGIPRTCESNESTDPSKVNVDLETAAIVIQFPSKKRESLKCNRVDLKNDVLMDFSRIKLKKNEPAKVSVVIPSANHGLPDDESRGPSPLLDRWRLGGGCECGGWDMGCPLIVLDNHNVQKDETCVKLSLKGTKDKATALTMKMIEEGQYAVDFHAQLTSLQAFSICVAILHTTETSITVAHDSDRERLQCDSLRVFVEDEVKHLIDVVAEEDKRMTGKNENPTSFLVNPPFSPMSRA